MEIKPSQIKAEKWENDSLVDVSGRCDGAVQLLPSVFRVSKNAHHNISTSPSPIQCVFSLFHIICEYENARKRRQHSSIK